MYKMKEQAHSTKSFNTESIIYTQHTVHLRGHGMDNSTAHPVPHLPIGPQEGWGLRTAYRGGGDRNRRTLFPSWSFSSLCPWWSVILWACKYYGLPLITSGRGLRWTKRENINSLIVFLVKFQLSHAELICNYSTMSNYFYIILCNKRYIHQNEKTLTE